MAGSGSASTASRTPKTEDCPRQSPNTTPHPTWPWRAARTARAAIREWANAENRNGPKSVDLPDIVEILVATGLRIGEVLALRWSDIELTAPPARRDDETWMPWLMVNGQITAKGKRVDYGKTDAAIRPIALPDWAAALLRRRKVAQPPPNDLDAVFITRNGTWHHHERPGPAAPYSSAR